MNFFENVKIAAKKTFNIAAQKTGEIVEDSKTKYGIFDLKNEINKIYTEIGGEVYAAYKEDRQVSEVVEEKCAKIDEINAQIEELRKKLD